MTTATRRDIRLLSLLAVLIGASACAPARPRPTTVPEPVAVATDIAASDSAATGPKALMVPVEGIGPSRVVDTYTAGRGGGRTHDAVDIMAPRGTPVLAAEDGAILKFSQNPAGGITIYQLDPTEQYVYYYAHLERYQRGLSEGDRVRQGDVLGFVGTTGNAPDHIPHLHFQVMRYRGGGQYWGGEPVNPSGWFTQPGRRN
jgi:murein DD-endopeptidase MepM/ murein hydrolase activator NlpD